MKVLVIGAAGKSGEALVNEALAAGHKVTAFVRGAAQYKKANVRVVAGDVLDAAAVDVAVRRTGCGDRRAGRQDAVESDDDGNERGTQYCGRDAAQWRAAIAEDFGGWCGRERQERRLLEQELTHADVSAWSAGRQGGHGGRDRRQQLGLDARAAADVDRRREDRRSQGAEHGGRREGAQDRAGGSGSLHGAATGKQPVCASGRDSDDHIARPPRGSTTSLIEAIRSAV